MQISYSMLVSLHQENSSSRMLGLMTLLRQKLIEKCRYQPQMKGGSATVRLNGDEWPLFRAFICDVNARGGNCLGSKVAVSDTYPIR